MTTDRKLGADTSVPVGNERQVDTLVIGSGIAGLFAAIRATRIGSVMLVTKSDLEESNTRYAQGGIAAAIFGDDSAAIHAGDTVAAGAGLCDSEAVNALCLEAPERISDLLALGVQFDRDGTALARGLEAAHSRARVLHAGGDATGAGIEAALVNAARATGMTIRTQTALVDLLTDDKHGATAPTATGIGTGTGTGTGTGIGRVRGALFVGAMGEVTTVRASAVVLATGGAGQVYKHTTNPSIATGDGTAAAFRAGAVVGDSEFFQFHPTALALPGSFLISEAVRGEGAVLRDRQGRRFMTDVHPAADLAPRDVVAQAITEQMAASDGEAVFLDATGLGREFLSRRFPNIDSQCRALGLDWASTPIPVTPAAHYWMGGVRTDSVGHSTLPGLYVVGEAANTGVHGANRLASNSLLEGLVFGARAVEAIEMGNDAALVVDDAIGVSSLCAPLTRREVQTLTWNNVGVCRDEPGLKLALKSLAQTDYDEVASVREPCSSEERETANLTLIAKLIATAALARTESRGAHRRSDYPGPRVEWLRHLSLVRDEPH